MGYNSNRLDTWSDRAHQLNCLLLNCKKEIKASKNVKNNKRQEI